jgi:hypothetical protein
VPTKQDLFGGSRTGVSWAPEYASNAEITGAFEGYLDEMNKSLGRADEGRDFWPGQGPMMKNARPPKAMLEQRTADLGLLETLSKSVSGDALASMQGQLDEMRERLSKDWDSNFPESGNITIPNQLAPIDLEGPAKLLVPRETPLVNSMPRENNGIGSAVNYKRILGWSNSGVGGAPDLMPFMASEFPSSQSTANLPQFGGYSNTSGGVASGGLGLRRGQKITYVADAHQVSYVELSLSDVVSTKAYYIGQGYQDPRQLSATALLWSHKGGEERAMLYGRGVTGLGYTGPVAAPAGFVGGSLTPSNTGGALAAGTYSFVLTAIAGGGESVPSAVATAGTAITGSTGSVVIALPAMPAGGMGFNLYALNATTGSFFYQGTIPGGNYQYTLTSYTSSGPTLVYNSTQDSTANPNGYDGVLTVGLNPSLSGYVAQYVAAAAGASVKNSISGAFTPGSGTVTAAGDTPWQNAFAALYGASTQPGNYGMASGAPSWQWVGGTAYGQKLLARPQTVFVDGTVRAAMGQYVRSASGGATAYRVMMAPAEATGGMNVGAIVNGLANQVTGDMVDFDVHPYMPIGTSFIWTKTLPIPDSEITNTIVAKNVQDYLYQMWPQIQFTFDASTYQLGSLVHYAPAWSGAIAGLMA